MFFSKKKKKEIKPAWQIAALKEFKEFRGMGDKFKYLGIEMTVCGYKSSDYEKGIDIFTINPQLKADYVDKNGNINSLLFDYDELETIKAENL